MKVQIKFPNNAKSKSGAGGNQLHNSLMKFLIFVLFFVLFIVMASIFSSCASVKTEDRIVHKEVDSVSVVQMTDSVAEKSDSEVSRVVDVTDRQSSVQDSVSVSEVTREVTTIYIDTTGKEINRCTSVFCDRQTDHWHNAVSNNNVSHYELDSLRSLTNIQTNRLKELEKSQAVIDSVTHSQTVKSTSRSWKADVVEWGMVLLFMLAIFMVIRKKTS